MIAAEDAPSPFRRRIAEALSDLAQIYMEALNASERLPVLSVSAFTKRYKISRSTLYDKYPTELALILSAFASLSDAKNERDRATKRKSVSGLQKELAETRKEMKRQIAVAHSVTLNEFFHRYGPVLKDAEERFRERSELIRTIDDLRQQKVVMQMNIEDLMRRANSRS